MQKIDLHGVKHCDVSKVICKACSTMEIPFLVITGNSPHMKGLVATACRPFKLKVRDAFDNPGRVVVYEAS